MCDAQRSMCSQRCSTQELLELGVLNLTRAIFVDIINELLDVNGQPEILLDDFDQGAALHMTALIRVAAACHKRINCKARQKCLSSWQGQRGPNVPKSVSSSYFSARSFCFSMTFKNSPKSEIVHNVSKRCKKRNFPSTRTNGTAGVLINFRNHLK